ncbi:hypothetical protein N5853_06630 [Bartonella sp. HY329]|uniref:DUF1254 domain-containing protein n=1 Tax=unclassified Bartonella TaxID=2645622 RepID=UPI0021C584CA|nr:MULTISPECIES: hypothetical protein [unclassified Bartonella]UXM96278.1 hypothetical protein N5853_06630 [Bartonella sp. HY329]UXN10602.1 hypothetical protein N5852_06640 [Bartonella sp. HY328]
MIRIFYIALMAVLGAIIVHITLLFLYPTLQQQVFWGEIKQLAPANQFTALPAQNSIIQETDPIAQIRLCHFDLSNNPIHFYAKGNVAFWSLSIYNDKGDNLYSINDRTSPDQILDLVLGDPIQIMDYRQIIADKIKKPVLTQQSLDRGFAILRVLKPSNDWQKNIDTFFSSAKCSEISD